VTDDSGVHIVINDLLSSMSSSATSTQRWAAVVILQSFCERSRTDYTDYMPQLLRAVIHMTVDTDPRVLHAAWDCLDSITRVLLHYYDTHTTTTHYYYYYYYYYTTIHTTGTTTTLLQHSHYYSPTW